MLAFLLLALGALTVAIVLSGCEDDHDDHRERHRHDDHGGHGDHGGHDRQTLEYILPSALGPAQRFEVRVQGVTKNSVATARVHADRLQSGSGLVLDTANIALSQVRFNPERSELLGVGRAEFQGVIRQDDLNAYLPKRQSAIQNLRIRITPQGAQLRGSTVFPGSRPSAAREFTLNGRLGVDDRGRVHFEPVNIQVAGSALSAATARALVDKLNPLVDLTGMRVPVYLQNVSPGSGQVQVSGRAELRPGIYRAQENATP